MDPRRSGTKSLGKAMVLSKAMVLLNPPMADEQYRGSIYLSEGVLCNSFLSKPVNHSSPTGSLDLCQKILLQHTGGYPQSSANFRTEEYKVQSDIALSTT
jgi:hypothetical protein